MSLLFALKLFIAAQCLNLKSGEMKIKSLFFSFFLLLCFYHGFAKNDAFVNLIRIHKFNITVCPSIRNIKASSFVKIYDTSLNKIYKSEKKDTIYVTRILSNEFDEFYDITQQLSRPVILKDTALFNLFGEVLFNGNEFKVTAFLVKNARLLRWNEQTYSFTDLISLDRKLTQARKDLVKNIILPNSNSGDLTNGNIEFFYFMLPYYFAYYHSMANQTEPVPLPKPIQEKHKMHELILSVYYARSNPVALNGNIDRIYQTYEDTIKPILPPDQQPENSNIYRDFKKQRNYLKKYKKNFEKYPHTLQFTKTWTYLYRSRVNRRGYSIDLARKEAINLFNLVDTLEIKTKEIKMWEKLGVDFRRTIDSFLASIDFEFRKSEYIKNAGEAYNNGNIIEALAYNYILMRDYHYDSAFYAAQKITDLRNINLCNRKIEEKKPNPYWKVDTLNNEVFRKKADSILNKDINAFRLFSGAMNFNIELERINVSSVKIIMSTSTGVDDPLKKSYGFYDYSLGKFDDLRLDHMINLVARNIKNFLIQFQPYLRSDSILLSYLGGADASPYTGSLYLPEKLYEKVKNDIICPVRNKGDLFIECYKFKNIYQGNSNEKNLALAYMRAYRIKDLLENNNQIKQYIKRSKIEVQVSQKKGGFYRCSNVVIILGLNKELFKK